MNNKKWEYLVIESPIDELQERLNQCGDDEWEIFEIRKWQPAKMKLVFKREKRPPHAPARAICI